jgi:hypothetical protein
MMWWQLAGPGPAFDATLRSPRPQGTHHEVDAEDGAFVGSEDGLQVPRRSGGAPRARRVGSRNRATVWQLETLAISPLMLMQLVLPVPTPHGRKAAAPSSDPLASA